AAKVWLVLERVMAGEIDSADGFRGALTACPASEGFITRSASAPRPTRTWIAPVASTVASWVVESASTLASSVGRSLQRPSHPQIHETADQLWTPSLDEVQFTVYRPRAVRPGEWYPMLAFIHIADLRPDSPKDTPDPIEEVRVQAEQILGARA